MNRITLSPSTGKEVLIGWLKYRENLIIAYYDLERNIVEYGEKIHKVHHTIAYYERQFRLLKKEPQTQLNNSGLSLEEITGGKVAKWKINLLTEENK
jgi:hypothetical protein